MSGLFYHKQNILENAKYTILTQIEIQKLRLYLILYNTHLIFYLIKL